jgi:hypothetical protein
MSNIDLGNAPIGTPPTPAEQSQIRTAIGLSSLSTTVPASGIATFLATPTSANLAAAVTDETGSGSLVFSNQPTLTSPSIAGTAQFTGTSRPTSAATGSPAATDLITRADGDARFKSITEFQVSSTPTILSGSSNGGAGLFNGPTYVIGWNAGPVAGQVYGQIITAPSIVDVNTTDYGYFSGTGNGSIIDFSIPWSVFFKLIFNRSTAEDSIIRVGVGELFAGGATLPSFGANGFGIRVNRKSGSTTVHEVRIIGKVRQGWEPNFVTGASNASPIVITSSNNGLQNGDLVEVVGVGGNTAANGIFQVANVTTTSFELVGSTGNGAFTSGGAYHKISQPVEINTGRVYDIELQNTVNAGIYGCNLRINGQLVLSMTGINRFHNLLNVRSGAGMRAGIQNISAPTVNYAYLLSSIRFVQPI